MPQQDAPASHAAHGAVAPVAPATWPPSAAASAPVALVKVLTGMRYATSPQGRQHVTEAESTLFQSIIMAGVIWIALRAWLPTKKRPKK